MAQELKNLEVSEVSLVSVPANASVDPITGKRIDHSVVAIFKGDSSANMELEQILKADNVSRNAIVDAVVQRAEAIAKRDGISRDKAEGQVWETPGLYPKYLAAKTEFPRAADEPVRITKSEAALDARIAKRMRETGESLAKATEAELMTEAGATLYKRGREERAAGQLTEVAKRGATEDRCPDCKRSVGPTDPFCANCGAPIGRKA